MLRPYHKRIRKEPGGRPGTIMGKDTVERLLKYAELSREYELQNERLVSLQDKRQSPGSPSFADKVKYISGDSVILDQLSKQEELTKEVSRLREKVLFETKYLEQCIMEVKDPNECAILRMRYIDNTPWECVVEAVYKNEPDFYESYDNYYRNIFRVHRRALKKLEALK